MQTCRKAGAQRPAPFFFLSIRPRPRSTLFPYTTLFRSGVPERREHGLDHPLPSQETQQMLQKLIERGRKEKGLNLIHVMIAFLVISILITIAIPTFLGARTRAQDRQAQSNLRNAFAAEKVVYTDRSEEHTSELQSRPHLVCRHLLATTNVTAAADAKAIYVVTANTDG